MRDVLAAMNTETLNVMDAGPVLVVDDDADLREAVTLALAGAGYDVIAVPDGAIALGLLTCGTMPGAILLDLTMPVMDGWEFRHHQLADPALAAIPVIIISADSRADMLAGSPGVRDVLLKPVDVDVLLRSLARIFAG